MPNITAEVGETLLFENGIAVTFVAIAGGEVQMTVNSRVMGRHTAPSTPGDRPERLVVKGPHPRLPKRPFNA